MIVNITKFDGKNITFIDGKEEKVLEKENWVKSEFVKLGDAEITIKNNKISFVVSIEDQEAHEKKAKKSDKKWEDDIVTFETLLTKAHEMKVPFSIKTKMLELDVEKKFALFKARVIVGSMENDGTKTEEVVFEGHGDATADNVTGEFIKPHFIRLAETRSIVRALRWYTNNGCAEEEK